MLAQAKSAAATKRRIRRNKSNSPHHAVMAEDPMHDIETERPEVATDKGIVFGVYGLDDFTTNEYLRGEVSAGRNTLSLDSTWIVPANFKLHEFVLSKTNRYNFMSTSRALAFLEKGLIEVSVVRQKLSIEMNGEPNAVISFFDQMDKKFKRAENMIEWVYSARGDSISVPLNYRPAIKGAYPWLPKDIESYIDDYMNSDASVLILLGPPGTGKTTFIKNLIHRSGADAKVTYDEKVMGDDSLFAGFIEGDEKFLIMEDADTFLASREDGNTMSVQHEPAVRSRHRLRPDASWPVFRRGRVPCAQAP
jgi:hypothetical protein